MDGGNADISGAIYLSPCPNHYDNGFGYSVTAPALLYLLHPCSRMPSADFAMDGVYEENAGAIFFLLFNHLKSCPNRRYAQLLRCY